MRLGTPWFGRGSVGHGRVRSGLAWSAWAGLALACSGVGWQAAVGSGKARPDGAGLDMRRPGVAVESPGRPRQGMARSAWVRRCRVGSGWQRHDLARHGLVGRGMAGRDVVRRGVTRGGWMGPGGAGRGGERRGKTRQAPSGHDVVSRAGSWQVPAWRGLGGSWQAGVGHDLAWMGVTRLGKPCHRLGAARHDWLRHGAASDGPVGRGREGCDGASHASIWRGRARTGLAWHGEDGQVQASLGGAVLGSTGLGLVRRDPARCRQGPVRSGMARRGLAWRD